ncbi:antifreeze protein [Mycena sp. CBHHK59/15]|nr:antifreeze protein [Mycena sp. CBHHK59/15]
MTVLKNVYKPLKRCCFLQLQPNSLNNSTPKLIDLAIIMISSVFTISFLAVLGSVVAVGPAAVNLRTAANYAILAESGVTTVPPSVITGAVAVSPIAAGALTGFSLTLDSTGQFSTSSQVVGKLFAASYAAPTPSTLTVAIGDMGTAFTDATGRANPNFSNLASGAIGGLILAPGLYKWTSAVSIGSDVTIAGGATDTWIFQVTGTLSIATGKRIVLAGGALASNIVWVVTGAVTAGAGSHLEGVVLGKTSITLQTGTTANSRLLAQTFVALQKATVTN